MNDKIKTLLKQYDKDLETLGYGVFNHKKNPIGSLFSTAGLNEQIMVSNINSLAYIGGHALSYARWMIQEMLEDKDDKFYNSDIKTNRWLGFIQGIMWMKDRRGIQELREESRGLYYGNI